MNRARAGSRVGLLALFAALSACSSTPETPPAPVKPKVVHFAIAAAPEIGRETSEGADPYEVFANVVTAFTTMTGTGKGYGRTEISAAVIIGPLVSAKGKRVAERGEDVRVAGESVTVPMLLVPGAAEAKALGSYLEGIGHKGGKPTPVRGANDSTDFLLCPEGLTITDKAPGLIICAATVLPRPLPAKADLVIVAGEGLEADTTTRPPVVTIPRLTRPTPRLFTVTIKDGRATFRGWPADRLDDLPDKPLSELVVKLK